MENKSKKITKKTKYIIGGLALLGLFFAYKQGVFGGKKDDVPTDPDAPAPADAPIIDNRAKYVAPDKPTQASTPPADRPSGNATTSGGAPVSSPPPPPRYDTMQSPTQTSNPVSWSVI
jgi:hypothetical protein